MKIQFWLLDINDRVVDGKLETLLWGIDANGRRVLVVDRGFQPYFYLLLEDDADFNSVINEIKKKLPSPSRVELEKETAKKFFGRRVRAIKVTCNNPDEIAKHAPVLAKLEGVKMCLEEDVRPYSRYLIDNDINPCGWCEIDVKKIENRSDAKVGEVYLAEAPPKPIERQDAPTLRILSFSTLSYSARGTPRPERDPLIIISLATNSGETRQLVAEDSDDRAIIEDFVEYVQNFDPDVISGYGTNTLEWPYLLERSRRHSLQLLVDRSNSEPHMSTYGHISVAGRANIDFYEFADEVPEVKVKTLENIAEYIGVMKVEDRTLVEETDIPHLWTNPEKRSLLLRHSLENAQSILGVTRALLDFAIQLSNLVGLPLDHVGTAAVGFRTESYLMKQAFKFNELTPPRIARPYLPYEGATVLKPRPGLHGEVAVLDFRSMYPNIMMSKNISPDTYLNPKEQDPPSGAYVTPEVKHRFRKEPRGLYSNVLSSLIAARDEIRGKLAKLSFGSPQYRVLDARQKAVKVLTNAVYGYAGWVGARWYSRPVAEATTAWGRDTIMRTIALAEKMGLDVIYGDTDSIFVKHDPEKTGEFLKRVEEELELEIRPDKVYKAALFTEAKKRYAGLLPDGRLDIVGLEVARGDWTEAAKNLQERVLEIILKDESPEKAVAFVHQYIRDLRAKKIPYRDLVIWKTLTKPLEEYKVRAPHVEAAKILLEKGWELTMDDKIGFVIIKGKGKLYERAEPYSFSSYDELDMDYYEENQIIPVAHRVLATFNVSKESLKPQASINKFLR